MTTKMDIGKFDQTKFLLWKLKMKELLIKDNCLEAINTRPQEFTNDEKWKRIDELAIFDLHLSLSDDVLSGVEEKTSAKEIWDHLTKMYNEKSLHNKIFLKRKLHTLRMSESTLVIEHINTLTSLCS
ncbi:hypothetical protein QN277_012579 [Acacia crassicarpa]|uniref:Retrovirus-related Pol polyprotein from transposon TNT 1-94 n=1 Tax=Acacia crassicarpa TaxID=499986 RepID=A0AAE1N1M9_9FABA|nr:hypothetical protein QN277_012579 [Acacia crassicarpa]